MTELEFYEENHTYCENHLSYRCPDIDYCDPKRNYYPAMNQCRAYLKNIDIPNFEHKDIHFTDVID